nr:keratin-associated protein 5-5-like [Aegilops tauschii subsp. strangulata]
MENDEEGCTLPTADVADFEVAARGENSMPKIPDATYEIEWIGTPAGTVDAGPELTCDGCCSGAPGAAEASRSGGCHCSQGGAVVAVDGSCSGPASAAGTPRGSGGCGRALGTAEAARSGGCRCSQGRAMVAVDGSCSGPASAVEAAWCSGYHDGAVAAVRGAAGCGP